MVGPSRWCKFDTLGPVQRRERAGTKEEQIELPASSIFSSVHGSPSCTQCDYQQGLVPGVVEGRLVVCTVRSDIPSVS